MCWVGKFSLYESDDEEWKAIELEDKVDHGTTFTKPELLVRSDNPTP